MPYMLGLLLHGLPGTGKTRCMRLSSREPPRVSAGTEPGPAWLQAIANVTGRHIICVSLEDIKTKRQLKHLFQDEARTASVSLQAVPFGIST